MASDTFYYKVKQCVIFILRLISYIATWMVIEPYCFALVGWAGALVWYLWLACAGRLGEEITPAVVGECLSSTIWLGNHMHLIGSMSPPSAVPMVWDLHRVAMGRLSA